MAKKVLPFIIALIIIGGGAFYGGMKFAQSKAPQGLAQADFQGLRNLSPEERQQRLQEFGGNIEAGFRGGQTAEGFVNGTIITKDSESITVQLRDGGSKIVFFSDATDIKKLADGSLTDLKEGEEVLVNGEQNSDGSITAKTIQLSPVRFRPEET